MKIIETSQGSLVAFGFDGRTGKKESHLISWSDPGDQCSWDPRPENAAGWVELPFVVEPEFVREVSDNTLVAYQPGVCIEMKYCGAPYFWSIRTLKAE